MAGKPTKRMADPPFANTPGQRIAGAGVANKVTRAPRGKVEQENR